MVESWVDSMETLFDDLCTLERDKVHLATHYLERTANEFWGLLFTNHFPDSEKRKLQDQFRKLRQGNRSVGDYEREFSHIIGCVPDVVLDRALWAEHGNAHIREEREASEKDKGKKRATDGSGGQLRSRKPPKYPRTQFKGCGNRRCVICGGDHDPNRCKQKEGRCYTCGQVGHMSRYCPVRTSPASSIASAPATPGYYGGAPPAVVPAGRAMAPRQPEVTRWAPSGRVFAAQAEEPAEAEERNVVAVTMPITRSQSAGADNAANFEEVETSATSGSNEAEAAQQQIEAVRRQEARMKCLEDLLLQQAAASRETQDPTPPAPVVDVAPRAPSPAPSSSRAAPVAAPQEEVLVAPPVQRPPVGAAFPTLVEGAERDRLMERLNEFRRCSPRVFDGEKVDHWIVEKWLMHMEKLFRDTFVEERDRVWLATHHLDGEAYRWWLDFQDHPSTDLAAITWTRATGL
uniref:CCHC-type domain-containing protein n=1 Tax=Ananas comosus var. bracteatus TaxID=296719 RepID=A0A6V7NJ25_ANACO|nr:unnamed protein product [Ananas comosus var. bracteatus]